MNQWTGGMHNMGAIKQDALVKFEPGRNAFTKVHRVTFYRNDNYQFDVVCRDASFAEKLATAWREGGTQAIIAQMVHNAQEGKK